MFYKTEDLIASAKRSEFFPVGQTTFSDPDDLIAFANEEMQTKLVPSILSAREDFFLTKKQINIQGGLNRYALPERAIGNALKDLLYMPNATDQTTLYPLAKTTIHDIPSWGNGNVSPGQFYLEGDDIIILPTPSSTQGALLPYYFARPNQLVSTTSCAKITAVTVGPIQTTLTVNTDLTNANLTTPIAASSLIDLLSAKSPFKLWSSDVSVQSITSTTIVLNNSDIQDAASNTLPKVGDYVCPAQQANIPMIPSEFHPILSEMIAYRALKAIGDVNHMQVVKAHIQEMIQDAFKLIAMRIEQEMDVVYERSSILNSVGLPSFSFAVKL